MHLQLLLVIQQLNVIPKLVLRTTAVITCCGLRKHHQSVRHAGVVTGIVLCRSSLAFLTLALAIRMTHIVHISVTTVLWRLGQILSLLGNLIVNRFYSHLSCEILGRH